MRRITLWALSTLTTLVLLFSYHTSTAGSGVTLAAGTSVQAPAAAGSGSDGSSSSDSGTSSSGTDSGTTGSGTAGSGTSSSGTSDSGSASSRKTYDGDAVQTRWGRVQVQITVQDGKITASEAIVYPNGNHEDAQINSVALPVLSQEAVQKQIREFVAEYRRRHEA